MEFNKLKEIGLTEGEIKVYDALLELGESTKTRIAEKSNVSPSKIYDVLHRLKEKGLVSAVEKNSVMHFSAADPENIRDYIEKKKKEIEKEQEMAEQIIPSLLLKYKKTKDEADVEVFYGWNGLRTVYNDVVKALSKKDTNYVFGASMGHDSRQADIFFSQYYQLVEKMGFKVKIIFNENVRGYKKRTDYYENTPRHEVRYLHQDTFTELSFYNNTVLFIMLFKKPIIIRVTNKEAADSFKKFFDIMWGQAEK